MDSAYPNGRRGICSWKKTSGKASGVEGQTLTNVLARVMMLSVRPSVRPFGCVLDTCPKRRSWCGSFGVQSLLGQGHKINWILIELQDIQLLRIAAMVVVVARSGSGCSCNDSELQCCNSK